MNAIKLFLRYNLQVMDILRAKTMWFILILLFGTLANYIIASLTQWFAIVPFFLGILLNSFISLAITYLSFASNDISEIKKELYELLDFTRTYYPLVFLSQLLFATICFIGLYLFIIPGVLALFYLSYCYFFVMLEGQKPLESIVLSYRFVKKIWPLQLIVLLIQVLIVAFLILILSSNNIILVTVLQNMAFMYYVLIGLVIFVDNKALR